MIIPPHCEHEYFSYRVLFVVQIFVVCLAIGIGGVELETLFHRIVFLFKSKTWWWCLDFIVFFFFLRKFVNPVSRIRKLSHNKTYDILLGVTRSMGNKICAFLFKKVQNV